jgi:hypothetical protein
VLTILRTQPPVERFRGRPQSVDRAMEHGRCLRLARGGMVERQVQGRGTQHAFLVRLDAAEGFKRRLASRGGVAAQQMDEREVPEDKRDAGILVSCASLYDNAARRVYITGLLHLTSDWTPERRQQPLGDLEDFETVHEVYRQAEGSLLT